jgi:hypothetical protein
LKELSFSTGCLFFTPLENPAIYGGDGTEEISTPYRNGGALRRRTGQGQKFDPAAVGFE